MPGKATTRGPGKAATGGAGSPTSAYEKLGGTTGKQDIPCNPVFQWREIEPQNLLLKKSMRFVAAGETPSLTREFVGETHRGLEDAQAHPPTRESALEGPSLIVGSGGSD